MHPTRERGIDIGLLLAVLAAVVIGLLAIASASFVADGMTKVLKQVGFSIIGMTGMVVLMRIDYRVWSRYWRLLLALTILALIGILFTPAVKGAHSWLRLGPLSLEPSEFAKLSLTLAFAALLSRFGGRLSTLPYFLRALAMFVLPVLLVMRQPALGTAAILCAICFVMLYYAGARWWMLAALGGGAVLCFVLALTFGLVKSYQRQRLDFLHADQTSGGYHQLQARIAIGSGELWGKGPFHGTQGQRGFLPEQETDFIFAVIGEEYGFLGCLAVLGLQLFILIRVLRVAEEAETPFGRLIAVGVAAMLGVHVLINISMCLTLSPVTGVPLPFISYGGSSLLTNMLAIGIVLNISRHRKSRRRWAEAEEGVLVRGV